MADIQQWRKKVPSRARLPMLEADAADMDVTCIPEPLTPNTKQNRPKLTSLFATQACVTKVEPSVFDISADNGLPSWTAQHSQATGADAEHLIDAVMCRLLPMPYQGLEPRFNSMLLRIFEAYRSLREENERVSAELHEEKEVRQAEKVKAQLVDKEWEDEVIKYKAEVKRLELIIARGKGGLAEVTKVRQGRVLPPRSRISAHLDNSKEDSKASQSRKETLVEFLEQSRLFDDRTWRSQRATMRTKHPSPPRVLNYSFKGLIKKDSMTNVRAKSSLDTPSPSDPNARLARNFTARLDGQFARSGGIRPVSDTSTSCSAETQSTFSCAGDLLPDEDDVQAVTPGKGITHVDDDEETTQINDTTSRQRELSESSLSWASSNGAQTELGCHQQRGHTMLPGNSPTGSMQRPGRLMAKASGQLHRLRPQMSAESIRQPVRRFSFEPGDDDGSRVAPDGDAIADGVTALRKSVSLQSMPSTAPRFHVHMAGSPIEASPTASVSRSETRRSSKIPSPSYNYAARPRQEREDSTSSLLTAIDTTNMFRADTSCCSSSRSSVSADERRDSVVRSLEQNH